jgi:hypothetical protein
MNCNHEYRLATGGNLIWCSICGKQVTIVAVQDVRNREAALHAWRGNRNAYYEKDAIAAGLNPPTNEERSAVECFEWLTNPPQRYFIYVTRPKVAQGCTLGFKRTTVTTWTGDVLGQAHLGGKFESNFGDERYSITITGTNGKKYHGTYYAGAGDYARIKLSKKQ